MQQLSFKDLLQQETAKFFGFNPVLFYTENFYGREEKNLPSLILDRKDLLNLTPHLYEKFKSLCPRVENQNYIKDGDEHYKLITPREALIFISELVLKPKLGEQVFGEYVANQIANKVNDNVVISDAGFIQEALPLIKLSSHEIVHVTLYSQGFGVEKQDKLLTFKNDSRDYNLWDVKESIEYYLKENKVNGEIKSFFNEKLEKINNILNLADANREGFKKLQKPLDKEILIKFLTKVNVIAINNSSTNLKENLNHFKELIDVNKSNNKKTIFLLNGPAGSGKDFLANELQKIDGNIDLNINETSAIKEYQDLKILLLNCIKTKQGYEKLDNYTEKLPLYISKINNRKELYKDLIYLCNKLITDPYLNKHQRYYPVIRFVTKVSMALVLSSGGKLFRETNNSLGNELNFSYQTNHPYKNFAKDFLYVNLASAQKEIQNTVLKMLNENFGSLMKSGIISKFNDEFIPYGASISKEGLFDNLKSFNDILKILDTIDVKQNFVFDKEAIKEYQQILEGEIHQGNYLGYANKFSDPVKARYALETDLLKIFNNLLDKQENHYVNKQNSQLER